MLKMRTRSLTGLTGLTFLLIQTPLTQADPTMVLPSTINFPDPAILHDPSSDSWFSFATTSGSTNVQVASAPSATGPWSYLSDVDALPTPGAWVASNPQIWAPDVRQLPGGTFVMYYSGLSALANASHPHHCVGVAHSDTIEGPYVAQDDVWECPLDMGGAIDASGYYDTESDTRWVVYKIDGSSLCGGGECGNVPAVCPTPIMLQQVSTSDGMTKIGAAEQLLDRNDSDGPLIEAPDLVKVDGTFVLFFSSHCFNSPDYDIKYATAESVQGPYTRGESEVLGASTKDRWNLTSPGGATSVVGGGSMVFHTDCKAGRCLWSTGWALDDGKVVVT